MVESVFETEKKMKKKTTHFLPVTKDARRYYGVEADEAADDDFDQLPEKMGDMFEKKGKGKKKC